MLIYSQHSMLLSSTYHDVPKRTYLPRHQPLAGLHDWLDGFVDITLTWKTADTAVEGMGDSFGNLEVPER